MKNTTENSNKNVYDFVSLRVKSATKKKASKVLERINKKDDGRKVSMDDLLNYCIEKVTTDDEKVLQMGSITWVDEEIRLKKIWVKKHGKTSDFRWKEMLYTGALKEFINEHSRLQ